MIHGKIAEGYILKTEAMTSPKIAKTIVKAINKIERKSSRALGASTLPATSPTVCPRLRIDITREPKSCTAPIKIDPKMTQRSAGSQPHTTARAGPTIGPVPAIEVK